MSEKTRKQDRRTRYTRQTIKDTFLELLKQKSFTKITVTEICKNAEINRGTFYLHYYDIHDVLSDIFNDMHAPLLPHGKITGRQLSASGASWPKSWYSGSASGSSGGICLL